MVNIKQTAQVRHLRKGSDLQDRATSGRPTTFGYGTSKAALNHLAKTLAIQLGPYNIRVNAIAPGIVGNRGAEEWGTTEEQRIGVGSTPLERLGTPDEIAGCAVWLASPGGTFATGGVFLVDGGQSLKGMEGPHELRNYRREQARKDRDGLQ